METTLQINDWLAQLRRWTTRMVNCSWSHEPGKAREARERVEDLERKIAAAFTALPAEDQGGATRYQSCTSCGGAVRVRSDWRGSPVWCLRCYNEALGGAYAG